MTPNSCLLARNLSFSFGENPAIHEISVEFTRGKITGIMGPNGSGKSTLLKCLSGIIEPHSGDVLAFGGLLSDFQDKISYIPQKEKIDWDFPITVKDLVRTSLYKSLKWYERFSAELIRLSDQAIQTMGLEGFENKQIGQLSGGQQQRAFLARALASNAEVFLLDEPFTGLDAKATEDLIRILKKIRDDGKSVIVVHHDFSNAALFLDEIILLKTTVLKFGSANEVINSPELRRAFGFPGMGQMH